MIYAFMLLIVGGMLIGGAWSFRQQGKAWWTVILLALLGVLALGAAFWRVQQG